MGKYLLLATVLLLCNLSNCVSPDTGIEFKEFHYQNSSYNPPFSKVWAKDANNIFIISNGNKLIGFNGSSFFEIKQFQDSVTLIDLWGTDNALYLIGSIGYPAQFNRRPLVVKYDYANFYDISPAPVIYQNGKDFFANSIMGFYDSDFYVNIKFQYNDVYIGWALHYNGASWDTIGPSNGEDIFHLDNNNRLYFSGYKGYIIGCYPDVINIKIDCGDKVIATYNFAAVNDNTVLFSAMNHYGLGINSDRFSVYNGTQYKSIGGDLGHVSAIFAFSNNDAYISAHLPSSSSAFQPYRKWVGTLYHYNGKELESLYKVSDCAIFDMFSNGNLFVVICEQGYQNSGNGLLIVGEK
jgi:hypothetical protein